MDSKIERGTDGLAILHLTGRLDLASASNFKGQVTKLLEDGVSVVILYLAEVSFVDSSGLGAIVGGLKAARQRGGDLRLAGAQEQMLSLLELTTLISVLRPYATIEEAAAGH
ncbi:MAG: STAS domain-containing protein [Chloroflexi bacterium]|nr:STAS domain-containing protein [Chloroflexota bacterium]MDA1219902.1 STAS domain-containing protein [Chloroflexota bacterium]PKB57858.1 MAG: anti-anti-sigma factor [SAR202 cluster bacterium Casp-Chloro-G3]